MASRPRRDRRSRTSGSPRSRLGARRRRGGARRQAGLVVLAATSRRSRRGLAAPTATFSSTRARSCGPHFLANRRTGRRPTVLSRAADLAAHAAASTSREMLAAHAVAQLACAGAAVPLGLRQARGGTWRSARATPGCRPSSRARSKSEDARGRLAAEAAAAAEVASESRRLEAEVAAAAAEARLLKRRVDEEAAEVAAARGRGATGAEEEPRSRGRRPTRSARATRAARRARAGGRQSGRRSRRGSPPRWRERRRWRPNRAARA